MIRGDPDHQWYYGKYNGHPMPRGPSGYYESPQPTAIGFCPLCGTNARGTTGVRGVYDCPTCVHWWYDSRVGKQTKTFDDFFSHS